jgi:hypothetical protein
MSKYTAIIVEPRKHKALELVLTNFLTYLNNDWSIIIYHGLDNINYINDIINKNLTNYKNRITLKNLNVKNLTITDYNNLMTNRDFVSGIPTEIFLIFQTDTIICEQTKDLLYNFIEYDYVGAPWLDSDIGGNGGLSLRRKSKMLEIIDKCKYNGMNEDQYFSWGCEGVIINMPSKNKAKEFSIETIYNEKSFGIHKAWGYLTNNINEQCKNYSKLVELNIEKYMNINYTDNRLEIYLLIISICIIMYNIV